MGEIIRGGAEKVREAGGLLVGGHSIRDAELKYGMAVVGFVDPERIMTKNSARVGDRIFLTKPVGSGVISTALQAQKAKTATRQRSHPLDDGIEQCVSAADPGGADIGWNGHLGFWFDRPRIRNRTQSSVRLRIQYSSVPFLPAPRDTPEWG